MERQEIPAVTLGVCAQSDGSAQHIGDNLLFSSVFLFPNQRWNRMWWKRVELCLAWQPNSFRISSTATGPCSTISPRPKDSRPAGELLWLFWVVHMPSLKPMCRWFLFWLTPQETTVVRCQWFMFQKDPLEKWELNSLNMTNLLRSLLGWSLLFWLTSLLPRQDHVCFFGWSQSLEIAKKNDVFHTLEANFFSSVWQRSMERRLWLITFLQQIWYDPDCSSVSSLMLICTNRPYQMCKTKLYRDI